MRRSLCNVILLSSHLFLYCNNKSENQSGERLNKNKAEFYKKLENEDKKEKIIQLTEYNKNKTPFVNLLKFEKKGLEPFYVLGTHHGLTNNLDLITKTPYLKKIISDLIEKSKNIFFETNPLSYLWKALYECAFLINNKLKNTTYKNFGEKLKKLYQLNYNDDLLYPHINLGIAMYNIILNQNIKFLNLDGEIFKLIPKKYFNKLRSLDSSKDSIANCFLNLNYHRQQDNVKNDEKIDHFLMTYLGKSEPKLNNLIRNENQKIVSWELEKLKVNYPLLNFLKLSDSTQKEFIKKDKYLKYQKFENQFFEYCYLTGKVMQYQNLDKVIENKFQYINKENEKHWINLFLNPEKQTNEELIEETESRNIYWTKKIQPSDLAIVGQYHISQYNKNLINIYQQKGYKIIPLYPEHILNNYKKEIKSITRIQDIKKILNKFKNCIPYNAYYKALLYDITIKKLEITLKNFNDKEQKEAKKLINENSINCIKMLNEAIKIDNKLGYTIKECELKKEEIQKKLSNKNHSK
ncbi:MAG: hypothetical protein GY830_05025 [Bacteroidetes bacterium]|nr:hypothetical protein [Bacteroidota bacterium]